jgi:hypothetical protein
MWTNKLLGDVIKGSDKVNVSVRMNEFVTELAIEVTDFFRSDIYSRSKQNGPEEDKEG